MRTERETSVLSQVGTVRSILVVDDDEGIRSVLSSLFSGLGYRVVQAKDGEQALELFAKDSFSLVLTDFYMPGIDGFTLAARLKSVSPQTPIIMITGSHVPRRAERSCVDYVLFKPFQLGEVYRTVELALAGTPLVSGTQYQAGIQPQG